MKYKIKELEISDDGIVNILEGFIPLTITTVPILIPAGKCMEYHGERRVLIALEPVKSGALKKIRETLNEINDIPKAGELERVFSKIDEILRSDGY